MQLCETSLLLEKWSLEGRTRRFGTEGVGGGGAVGRGGGDVIALRSNKCRNVGVARRSHRGLAAARKLVRLAQFEWIYMEETLKGSRADAVGQSISPLSALPCNGEADNGGGNRLAPEGKWEKLIGRGENKKLPDNFFGIVWNIFTSGVAAGVISPSLFGGPNAIHQHGGMALRVSRSLLPSFLSTDLPFSSLPAILGHRSAGPDTRMSPFQESDIAP